MNCSTEKKIIDMENRPVVTWGEGKGVGGIGSLGLKNANYCFWNEVPMTTCCGALRIISTHLPHNMTMGGKIMYACMCNWVPMWYSGGGERRCNQNKPSWQQINRTKISINI